MSSLIDRFRRHDYQVPSHQLAWRLFGKGFEALGVKGRPERIPVPHPKRGEVLMRVDAVGLCFSDVKVIHAGNSHPRLRGRDLAKDPTTPGHEVSLTLVEKGEGALLEGRPGDRFIIQANVRWQGRDISYGYIVTGGLMQYNIFDNRVLAGDAGNYLIPVPEGLGLVDTALTEPWSCVEGSYRLAQRFEPLAGGNRIIVTPAGEVPTKLTDGAGKVEIVRSSDIDAVKAARARLGEECHDVFVVGKASGELVGVALDALTAGGILCLLGGALIEGASNVDVGRIHYRDVRIVGSRSLDVGAAYISNTRKDILPGGAALFPGAAGPMGIMHVQRALSKQYPPRVVVVTDISRERLEYAEKLLGPIAKKVGTRYASLNPNDAGGRSEYHGRLDKLMGGRGFDDIVVCAPVGAVIADAARHAGAGCVVNIFAGVPLGTMSELFLGDVATKHVRYIGVSGSTIDDMKLILSMASSGRLNTRLSLGAVGGMNQVLEGLQGVASGRFPGKVVIFPWIEEMPLSSPAELERLVPGVSSKLEGKAFWSAAVERMLLEKYVSGAPGIDQAPLKT